MLGTLDIYRLYCICLLLAYVFHCLLHYLVPPLCPFSCLEAACSSTCLTMFWVLCTFLCLPVPMCTCPMLPYMVPATFSASACVTLERCSTHTCLTPASTSCTTCLLCLYAIHAYHLLPGWIGVTSGHAFCLGVNLWSHVLLPVSLLCTVLEEVEGWRRCTIQGSLLGTWSAMPVYCHAVLPSAVPCSLWLCLLCQNWSYCLLFPRLTCCRQVFLCAYGGWAGVSNMWSILLLLPAACTVHLPACMQEEVSLFLSLCSTCCSATACNSMLGVRRLCLLYLLPSHYLGGWHS
jgi:hypothetical protein